MKRRVEKSRTESDESLYNKLLKTAEVATKFIVSGLVACIEDNKDRYRYRHKYNIVRADGIGVWGDVASKILTGPSASALHEGMYTESQQLNQRKSDNTAWQYQAVQVLHSALEVMYPECGEMPQSVKGLLWFQYLAHLRNKSNPHASPTSQQYTNASVYLEESLDLLISNVKTFERPWAKLIRNQSGKWNVTKIGGDREEFSNLWSKDDISLSSNSGVYVKVDGEYRYVDLVKTDKSAEEYYLPNGNFSDNKYELLSYHSNNRRFGDSSEYHTPPDTLPESETSGKSNLKVVGKTFTNLPEPIGNYVKREKLQEDLTNKLTNKDRYPIVTLRGRGGIGKTSLALAVLHKISKRPTYDAIFWFSSRDIDLQSSGPKPVSPDVISKYDIAKKFKDIYPTNIEKGSEIESIQKHMAENILEKPSLFVFDNFETIKNPEEIYRWIDTFIRPPNKVLITTRIDKFPAAYPIEVSGMRGREAKMLIEQTASNLGISGKINKEYVEEIADASEGHPYVIKVILGEISKGRGTSNYTNLLTSKADVLDALFERTWQDLSPLARRSFLTLCSWSSIIPKLSIKAVLMRNTDEKIDVDSALEELSTSSLIEVIESDADGEKFIDVPLAASVFAEKKLEVSPFKATVEADAKLLYRFGAMQRTDLPKGIAPRVQKFISNIIALVDDVDEYLSEYAPMIEHIARNHPPAWKHLADEVSGLPQQTFELERKYLRRFLQSDISASKSVWKRVAYLSKQLENSVMDELNAWAEYSTHPDSGVEEASEAANSLNSIFYDRQVDIDTEDKKIICSKVADQLKEYSSALNATDYSRLAWLYLHLRKEQKAEEATVRGLLMDRTNEYCQNLANRLEIDTSNL